MKKFFLISLLLSSAYCFSQSYDIKSVDGVKFFGVDYSQVRVFGAEESAQQFKYAFERINQLFITESKKYNVEPYINKKVYGISTDEVDQKIMNMDVSEMMTTDKYVRMTEEELQSTINATPIEPQEGVGLVFIADMLNKDENMGYYQIVFFDMQNKNIIYTTQATGKAGGFGLRNYWASTIHKILKSKKLTYN